jgi:hypothetical protein
MRIGIVVILTYAIFALGLGQANQTLNIDRPLMTTKVKGGSGGNAGKDTLKTISDLAYASGQIDTTEAIYCGNFKTVYLSCYTKDSLSLLIGYQVSPNRTTWSNLIANKDSLVLAAAGNFFKGVDFTSTVLGASWVRFHLKAQAWNIGVTTPTYTAKIGLKKY